MNPWPDKFPLFPKTASTMAGDVDAIYFFGLGVAAIFSLLIALLILFFAVKYRRRSPGEVGRVEHTSTWLEVAWSVIPLGILLFMFGWGANVFYRARRPPADAVEYYATAKQWMWKFQHPDGKREINHLHVPMGQPIKLLMTSEDVIHSFFVPAFRVKMDVLPGRYTTMWFEADTPGTYQLFCNEYCGVEHSLMIGSVVVMEPADYEAWLAQAATAGSVAVSGETLFSQYVCDTCHRADSAARAPLLAGLFGREVELDDGTRVVADESYLRESILAPASKVVKGYDPVMPMYAGRLSEEELLKLILYVKSLGGGAAAGREGPAPVKSSATAPPTGG